jgi:hypothetical protein
MFPILSHGFGEIALHGGDQLHRLSEGLMPFREFFQPLINGHIGFNVARVQAGPLFPAER